MIVKAVKTARLEPGELSLFKVMDKYLNDLTDRSVVAVASKVAAICEGRVVPIGGVDKEELVRQEAQYYLDPNLSKYGLSFTVTHNTLIPAAGIDESNGGGNYVLWPKEPQDTANKLRLYLKNRFKLRSIGVILTDSTARPLHYGTEGVAIAYSGFSPTNNYVGQTDLFGRPFKVSVSNIADALASAAVVVMGEGTEQTPIAVVEELTFVNFQDHDPTPKELRTFYISHMHDDLFAPFLKNAPWQKGSKK